MNMFRSVSGKLSQVVRQSAAPLVAALATIIPVAAFADTSHTVRPGYGAWWLPYNYSEHGDAFDSLFTFIFWLTMIVLIIVLVVMVYFLIKYRHNPDRVKNKFVHGNHRLEAVWTTIPALILAGLAISSKGVWEKYRNMEDFDKSTPTEVMVIAEQFNWNFVYPGRDGKFGQYMDYPNPTDPNYRAFPYVEAMKKINSYIATENPLGQNKQFEKEEAKHGKDDDYAKNPGRPLILPVGKLIGIKLSSKDVIHDFFLPNFRVKLDALPGMSGRINFKAKPEAKSTEDLDLTNPAHVAKIQHAIDKHEAAEKENNPVAISENRLFQIWIDSNMAGAVKTANEEISQIKFSLNLKGPDGQTTELTSLAAIDAATLAKLKYSNIQKITAVTKPFDLTCEELCGAQHYFMAGLVIFVSETEYKAFINKDDPKSSETPKVAEVLGKTPVIVSK